MSGFTFSSCSPHDSSASIQIKFDGAPDGLDIPRSGLADIGRAGPDSVMNNSQTILKSLLGAVILLSNGFGARTMADTNDLPHFQEVLRLLRANLSGVTDDELNRAAVEGLLNRYYPRVLLVTNLPSTEASGSLVSRASVYDKTYGYIRVAEVRKGLADQVALAYESLLRTNKLKGLVLDLRFAGGQDYEAAAKTADRFLTKEAALLDWQEGSARSTAKAEAIKLPVVVLVNRQTTTAAEALAAVLRETDVALLIGAPTAGAAHLFKEFPLSDGRKLRIASGSVQMGDGKKLPSEGVAPDIAVFVAGDDEALVFADPYAQIASSTSRSTTAAQTPSSPGAKQPRRRINEAELVRLQREGQDTDETPAIVTRPPVDENAEPVVRDPALARALDLLKGISVLGQARPR